MFARGECFRVTKDNSQYLSLEDVVEMAKKIGGDNHGFKFLPANLPYDKSIRDGKQNYVQLLKEQNQHLVQI